MKKTIFSAMVLTLFAFSCNQEGDLKQVVPKSAEGTTEQVEFYDSKTEKAYRFTFYDLYTENVNYTYEVLDPAEGIKERVVSFLLPSQYQILPSADESEMRMKLLQHAFMIDPVNPGTPIAMSSGGTYVITCSCKGNSENGRCLVSASENPEHTIVTAECINQNCKKDCKIGGYNETVISGSTIIYAK